MKKLSLIIMGALVTMAMSAKVYPVPLQDNGDIKHGTGERGPVEIPAATFDDVTNTLSLQSSSVIEDVAMTIRDENGNVLVSSMYNLNGIQSFFLDSNVVATMYSVELVYADNHLIGYFNLDSGEFCLNTAITKQAN